MRRIPSELKSQIIQLRLVGKSIPEIVSITGAAKTTVQRHVLGVEVPVEFKATLKEKQGGSKDRALARRESSLTEAENKLGTLSERDYILLLVGLYWGEGTKRDFGIINSDPALIHTFIVCLNLMGINKQRLNISLRVHSDISVPDAMKFWAHKTGLDISSIKRIEVIEGKKKGKLPYGMCRIRVITGIRERLLIQSMISVIGKDSNKKLVSGQALVV